MPGRLARISASGRSKNRRLDLLVYQFDAVLEGQGLCGELGDDAGGDRLGRQREML
jgi:hypothetical protein